MHVITRPDATRTAMLLAMVVLTACASAGGRGAPSPYLAECPLPAGVRGYPVAVRLEGGSAVDPAWLDAVAQAAAYRWAVPSRRRGDHSRWQSVRSRVLPPEPRWADDWTPDARHRAELVVTLHRDGSAGPVELRRASGDRMFDESLATIFEDPLPASPLLPLLPPLPPTGRDSARLRFTFGEEPAGRAGLVRFAVQQSPVEIESRGGGERVVFVSPGDARGTQRAPVPFFAVLKYDVDETGRVVPGSFELLNGDGTLADAIRTSLNRTRFTPARSNCRPVALTVLQRFGR